MGTNNKQRRAAKQRRKQAAGRPAAKPSTSAFGAAGPRVEPDQRPFAQAFVANAVERLAGDAVSAEVVADEVSRICAQLDQDVAAWRTRPLGEQEFPYVFLDATYCKVRINKRVVSQAVVIATGVSADGRREVLGCAVSCCGVRRLHACARTSRRCGWRA